MSLSQKVGKSVRTKPQWTASHQGGIFLIENSLDREPQKEKHSKGRKFDIKTSVICLGTAEESARGLCLGLRSINDILHGHWFPASGSHIRGTKHGIFDVSAG